MNKLFKYRYIIGIVVFIFCIIFELNSSSISMWNEYFNLNTDNGIILGISRAIRSDEWATFTPMTFSQYFDGFKYFSSIIRATDTDVFMIYGLPVMNIVQIFRPFQLGYLFLGISRGLSFFWFGRLIFLFLVSFDFMRIISNDKRNISFIGAILITLSPCIQWWFAINGIAEIFIFGELAIIMLYKYLNDCNLKHRLLYLFVIFICATGYILVIYPSWQIPMFYVFLALAIGIIIDNKSNIVIRKKDILSIVCFLILLLTVLIYIYSMSSSTIKIVMNTVYPGARMEVGGKGLSLYFRYLTNLFLPFKGSGLIGTNQCEMAVMFSLFPIGILLLFYSFFRNKNIDVISISMFIVYIFLGIWCVVGFPSLLAKISLMSNSQVNRSFMAVGFLDILILVRTISINEFKFTFKVSFVASFILALFITYLCVHYNSNYIYDENRLYELFLISFMFFVSFSSFYLILRIDHKLCKFIFNILIILIMLFIGGTINPIRRGVDNIYDSKLINDIKKINTNKDGIWISEGMDYPKTNFILMAGVKTLNSTNVYPDLNKWELIDPNGQYNDVYNRYAHIKISLNRIYNDKFELLNPDYFVINMSNNDLITLDINYIFTENDLEIYNDDKVKFVDIYNYDNYKIYEVVYSSS